MNRVIRSILPVAIALPCLAASLVGNPLSLFISNNDSEGTAAHAQNGPPAPLAPDDVSWLFPPPPDNQPAQFNHLISMADLKAHGRPVWSDAAFRQFVRIATGPAGEVAGTDQRIVLPPEVLSKGVWYISAVRFDPGAPGPSDDIRAQFGQEMQIRLVVQPVTKEKDGTPKVHDIAAHLVFEFNAGHDEPAQEGCFPRTRPDDDLSKQIAQELVDLRAKLGGQNLTAGKPLGVHPALASAATADTARLALKELLERHLSAERLGFMTITAIASDEQKWLFMGMINLRSHPDIYPLSPRLGFIPMHAPTLDGSQYAQMFAPASTQSEVVPTPYANNDFNVLPMTCRNSANANPGPPLNLRAGYTTSDILNRRPLPDPAKPIDPHLKVNPDTVDNSAIWRVVERIVDPAKSHAFNTDCVSCHTEPLVYSFGSQFPPITGIACEALPAKFEEYNVRAFGWQPHETALTAKDGVCVAKTGRFTVERVSRRTECETAAVLNSMNRLLGTAAAPPATDCPID